MERGEDWNWFVTAACKGDGTWNTETSEVLRNFLRERGVQYFKGR